MKNITPFQNIIGQNQAKSKLGLFLKGYEATRVVPHLMIVAPKGAGKTSIARAFGRNLLKTGENKPKRFIEINCSTIKGLSQFFNQVIIPHVNNQEVTVLFDEASELPKDVTMALLTILNPNKDNRNTFSYEEYTVDFDFRQQTFLFATTESQKMFHALIDRLERVDLEEYKKDELSQIIQLHLGDKHTVKPEVMEEVVGVLRGNARQAAKMAGKVKMFLDVIKKKVLDKTSWTELTKTLGILPLGLNNSELNYLRVLSRQANNTLTHMSACTGMSRSSLQRDIELHLLSNNLMKIDADGRSITANGLTYLNQIQ